MASHLLEYAVTRPPYRRSWFARLLTFSCAVTAIVLLGAGLYLMAIGGAGAAQSHWVSADVSSRIIGPAFATTGLAFFFVTLYRLLRAVRLSDRMVHVRRVNTSAN